MLFSSDTRYSSGYVQAAHVQSICIYIIYVQYYYQQLCDTCIRNLLTIRRQKQTGGAVVALLSIANVNC